MNDLTYEQVRKEKKRLLILEISEAVYLLVLYLLFYLVGYPNYISIIFVDVVPFIFTMFEFYPVIDLFNRKFMFTLKEALLFLGFIIVISAYITGMFLLR